MPSPIAAHQRTGIDASLAAFVSASMFSGFCSEASNAIASTRSTGHAPAWRDAS
jgi:hypothetical protein